MQRLSAAATLFDTTVLVMIGFMMIRLSSAGGLAQDSRYSVLTQVEYCRGVFSAALAGDGATESAKIVSSDGIEFLDIADLA